MSNEFLLVRSPEDRPLPEDFEDVDLSLPIGSMAEVKRAIEGAFPNVVWRERNLPLKGPVVFGLGGPEFQFHAEDSGFVTSIMMSRARVEDVKRLLPVLECLAMDLLEESIIRA